MESYKGYINGLNDPYSVYYNKKETKELYESTGGEYSGIGAVMSQNTETGVITLVQIYKDSPAEKAGLKDNDILYKVEGKEVTGIIDTTLGRCLFNEILPQDLGFVKRENDEDYLKLEVDFHEVRNS